MENGNKNKDGNVSEKMNIDDFESRMYGHSMKSHPLREVYEAYINGQEIYILDSGTSGNDDVLIGEYDEIITDIFSHYEVEEIPESWSITKLGVE